MRYTPDVSLPTSVPHRLRDAGGARGVSDGSRGRVGMAAAVLAEVRRPAIDVAVWLREPPAPLHAQSMLAEWAATTQAPPFDRIVDVGHDVLAAVSAAPDALRPALAADVSRLLDLFQSIARAHTFRLFFGVVRDDQCRKFHVDAVAMRMVTTYVGPGTVWLPEHAVDRAALARGVSSPAEVNSTVVLDPASVRHAYAGDVLMLKGSRHPDVGSFGAVHRSPHLHGGEARLVLVVTAGGPSS